MINNQAKNLYDKLMKNEIIHSQEQERLVNAVVN
jgi:hypothetical protein